MIWLKVSDLSGIGINMFDSILVVCTGNICRSPIGERMLQSILPNKKISSAGVQALENHPADKSARYIASQHNLSLEGHQGRQFNSSMASHYDLILAMDKSHIEEISRVCPQARGKTMLFGHWIGQKEIPDPYRKSEEAFASVYNLIEIASQSWAEKLSVK